MRKKLFHTSTVKRNIVANFLGRLWIIGSGIIFVPLYIKFIGIESYGLLGVFTALQTIMSLLDMGLTTTLNKELASYSVMESEKQYMNNLVKTMESIYIGISLVVLLLMCISSYFLGYEWVNPEHIDRNAIFYAFLLMSLNFSIQLPWGLYEGGLMGLQRQVLMNAINISLSIIKGPGAILILWLISPTIHAFLIWQIIINLIQLLLFRYYLWKSLPEPHATPVYDRSVFKKSGKFAAGVFGISFLIMLLSQTDKIILSKIVLLRELGYYSLAASVAAMLPVMVSPVIQAVFPKVTQLITLKDNDGLHRLFHLSSQAVAALVIPAGVSLFIFAERLIYFWTGDSNIATHAGEVLRWLILGNMFNSLMVIPYQYTLSNGWTGYGIKVTIVALIFYFPFILWAAVHHGITGSAIMWMGLNGVYLVLAMQYLFRHILQTEKRRWYISAVLKPLLVNVLCALPFYFLNYYNNFSGIVSVILCGCCVMLCMGVNLLIGFPALNPYVKKFTGKFLRQCKIAATAHELKP